MKASDVISVSSIQLYSYESDIDPFVKETVERALSTNQVQRFLASDPILDEFSKRHIYRIIEMRMRFVARSGRVLFGASRALTAIAKFDSESQFSWAAIPVGKMLMVLLPKIDTKEIVGCLALEARLGRRGLVTPPNWDGTKKMLIEYNKRL